MIQVTRGIREYMLPNWLNTKKQELQDTKQSQKKEQQQSDFRNSPGGWPQVRAELNKWQDRVARERATQRFIQNQGRG
jgi:hypothetical protein